MLSMFTAAAAALFIPLNILEEFRQREKHSGGNSKSTEAGTLSRIPEPEHFTGVGISGVTCM